MYVLCVQGMCAGVMSSKRKTSAPTRVLVDVESCQSDAVDRPDVTLSSPPDDARRAPVDYDSDQSHDRCSLRVVTSPSTTGADDDDDDDVTDDVKRSRDVATSESAPRCLGGLVADVTADVRGAPRSASGAHGSEQRQWLSDEVALVLNKIQSVVDAARSLDEKRRRVDEMLSELETIRRHLCTAVNTSQSVSVASLL